MLYVPPKQHTEDPKVSKNQAERESGGQRYAGTKTQTLGCFFLLLAVERVQSDKGQKLLRREALKSSSVGGKGQLVRLVPLETGYM